jgi:ATP-binding cassette subfamily C (CFTR/MRP) protein 1
MAAVVGGVGSFKSSLLLAFLGEVPRVRGSMRVSAPNSIAYSSQKSWLFSGTVRENILMSRPFDAARYAQVIEACELVNDLKNLQAGDMTAIGERGVNLSGGQKARVALARAAYSTASDIFLFDDPLSAVDAVVARRIFDKVIGPRGILANKTRILVCTSSL